MLYFVAFRRARSKYEWVKLPTVWKFQWSVSLMPLTSQFKDIIKRETKVSKMIVCGVSILDLEWNVKGVFEISYKIFNLYTTKYTFYEVLKVWHDLWYLSVLASWVLLRPALERRFNSSVSTLFRIMAPSHYLVEPTYCQMVLQIYSCG